MYILYILLYIDMKSTLSLSFYNIYILHPYILWLPRHFLRTAEALSLVIFIEGWCLSWISWLVFWDFSKPWFWWVEECEIKHDTQKNTKEHMLKWVPFTLRQSRMVCWNNSPFSLMMFSFKAPSNTLSNHLKGVSHRHIWWPLFCSNWFELQLSILRPLTWVWATEKRK